MNLPKAFDNKNKDLIIFLRDGNIKKNIEKKIK